MKIERPDQDGNGSSLDCGVAFVHTHPTGDRKKPVPYEEERQHAIENYQTNFEQKHIAQAVDIARKDERRRVVEKVEKVFSAFIGYHKLVPNQEVAKGRIELLEEVLDEIKGINNLKK